MKAYLHTKNINSDGSSDCHLTQEVPVKVALLWHHTAGVSFTATGYGARIPTAYMIKVRGKWRRVYGICYSNAGTAFIGKKFDNTNTVLIEQGD